MDHKSRMKMLLKCSVLPLAAATFGGPFAATAQEAAGPNTAARESFEEVVVTGTRRSGVTVATAVTPIDIVSSETLTRQGFNDTNDLLRTAIPSLNVQRFSAQSFSAAVRPFTLRGLAPDQTLVLINGKRRHRSALIQLSRLPLANGSQGPDLSTIPSIAIERIELLRDGAAAQYGSDAIAGVINFQLKRDNEGGSAVAKYGQFYEGDGENITLQGNIGLPLGSNGFVNISAEYTKSDPTSRGIQVAAAQAAIDAGNTAIADPAQRWGNPDGEGARVFVNAEHEGEKVTIYAFGNYAHATAQSTQFWRNPNPTGPRRDVFGSVPLTNMPGGPRFSFADVYPGGLLPVHDYKVTDASLTGGFKGDISDLFYDFSASYAQSKGDFGVFDTLNPSLGPDAPTEYYVGFNRQRELQVHADFVYGLETGMFASPLNVAFGAEYRRESFAIGEGEPDSYRAGPFARVLDPDTGQFIGLAIGASAFPGYDPATAGSWSRSNWAGYLDLETDVVEDLTLAAAARFEDFNDFGSTFNYKFAGRYEIVDWASVRASYNTGFRAPTPGQQNVRSLSTSINLSDGSLNQIATLPPSHPLSQYFGAQALKPEKSKNYSIGAVLNFDDGTLFTVDYFNIRVKDRISVTSTYNITPADALALAALGIQLNGTQGVSFFANAFDTKTQGFDAILSKGWDVGSGRLDLSAAVNYTKTSLGDVSVPAAVDRQRTVEIAHFNPRWRGHLTGHYSVGPWSVMARTNYYGKFINGVNVVTATAFDQTYSAKVLFDLEVSYNVTDNIRLSVGGENVFDTYPEKEGRLANINNGMQYPQHSPFGYNGGFWYIRADANF